MTKTKQSRNALKGQRGTKTLASRPSRNSVSGCEVKRCNACCKSQRDTKVIIQNGLRLIRIRYGLPYCELPDLEPSLLGRYHVFLLGEGKERPSVPFPRRQRQGENDLCSLQRLWRHERWELALSVASIKRSLPRDCPHHTPSARPLWESAVFSQPPPLPDEYLAFVQTEAARLFKPGWDHSYEYHVNSFVANAASRKERLSRADILWKGRQEEFRLRALAEVKSSFTLSARYKEVATAGKCRPLTIFDEDVDLLAPLHKTIFGHLARTTDWLLLGPPTPDRVSLTCTGEFQTSVDLVNASDGLYHSAADVLLDTMFKSCVTIPRGLRELAKVSYRPWVSCKDGVSRQVRHGQMMGAYLCFPLLCLQSYCAARWAARKDGAARFMVNGDDCVISADHEVSAQDYPPGFQLNTTKTKRARNVVELNSTVFLRKGDKWREIRHLRRGGALPTYDGMLHLANACVDAGPKWEAAFTRSRIGRAWGFLPSQLGHRTYPSFRRERTMLRHRHYTELPTQPGLADDRLVVVSGRRASPRETGILADFLFQNGRGGGLKRDVWAPSLGYVRRTYAYRSDLCVLMCPRKMGKNGFLIPCKEHPLISSRKGVAPKESGFQTCPSRSFGTEPSFVSWAKGCHASIVKRRVEERFYLPLGTSTDEELRGLYELREWAKAHDGTLVRDLGAETYREE